MLVIPFRLSISLVAIMFAQRLQQHCGARFASRRSLTPSLVLALGLALLAGCGAPVTRPGGSPEAATEPPAAPVPSAAPDAAALVVAGDWAGAAAAFLAAAEASKPDDQPQLILSAAQAFALQPDAVQAEAMLVRLPVELPPGLDAWRALVRDTLTNARVDLDGSFDPAQLPDLARSLYHLRRGRAAAAEARWPAALAEAIAIKGLGPQFHQEGLRLAWLAAQRSFAEPPLENPEAEAWLELARLLRDPGVSPQASLDVWAAQHIDHPALELLPGIRTDLEAMLRPARRIALLLPLGGRYAAAAEAVRDGFMAGWMQQASNPERPTVLIMNSDEGGFDAAYARAADAGADLIVGPLEREDVARLLDGRQLLLPTLALNVGAGPETAATADPTGRLLQFGLLPEREAEQAADYAVQQGLNTSVLILPAGLWGERMQSAFAARFQSLGGTVLRTLTYAEGEENFQGLVRRALDLPEVSATSEDQGYTVAEGAGLPGFIYVGGRSREVRQILPYLRYFGAGHLARATTSQTYTGTVAPDADLDLDGTLMTEIPWLVDETGVGAELRGPGREAWPARGAQEWRLFAFGLDAYQLALRFGDLKLGRLLSLKGATGHLSCGDGGVIQHQMIWTVFRGGRPRTLLGGP